MSGKLVLESALFRISSARGMRMVKMPTALFLWDTGKGKGLVQEGYGTPNVLR